MKNNQLAWLLGGALVVSSGGLGIAACSSDSGTGNPSTGTDSGGGSDGTGGHDTGSQQDTGGGSDTGSGGDTGGGTDGGGGAECGTTPSLHPGDGGEIYCPFGPDGGPLHCNAATTECCLGGSLGNNQFADSVCATAGTTCPNPPDAGRRIDCAESLDCTGNNRGTLCCATGGLPVVKAGCGFYNESPGFKTTSCVQGTTCAAGQFQLCTNNTECGAGKTCTPFKALGMQLGFCM